MSDYIKREDAIEAVRCYMMQTGIAELPYTYAKDEIFKVPSADVVEVVRCKDCKIGGWKVSEIDGKTKGYQCPVHAYIQDDNGYCSNGERKDGEEE